AGAGGQARESLTARILSRRRELVHRLIEECREVALPRDGKIDLRVAQDDYWELAGRVPPAGSDPSSWRSSRRSSGCRTCGTAPPPATGTAAWGSPTAAATCSTGSRATGRRRWSSPWPAHCR